MKCEKKKLNKGNAVKMTGAGGAWTCRPLQARPGALSTGSLSPSRVFAGTRPRCSLLAVGRAGCHLGGCGPERSCSLCFAPFLYPLPRRWVWAPPVPAPGALMPRRGWAVQRPGHPGRMPGAALRAQAGSALPPPPPGAESASDLGGSSPVGRGPLGWPPSCSWGVPRTRRNVGPDAGRRGQRRRGSLGFRLLQGPGWGQLLWGSTGQASHSPGFRGH